MIWAAFPQATDHCSGQCLVRLDISRSVVGSAQSEVISMPVRSHISMSVGRHFQVCSEHYCCDVVFKHRSHFCSNRRQPRKKGRKVQRTTCKLTSVVKLTYLCLLIANIFAYVVAFCTFCCGIIGRFLSTLNE